MNFTEINKILWKIKLFRRKYLKLICELNSFKHFTFCRDKRSDLFEVIFKHLLIIKKIKVSKFKATDEWAWIRLNII